MDGLLHGLRELVDHLRGDKHLTSFGEALDPGGLVHGWAVVIHPACGAVLLTLGFSRHDANAHPKTAKDDSSCFVVKDLANVGDDFLVAEEPLRPGDVHHLCLHLKRETDSINRAGKGDEEGVAFGLHLVATVSKQALAESAVMAVKDRLELSAEMLPQLGGALDIRESHTDSPRWRRQHDKCWLRILSTTGLRGPPAPEGGAGSNYRPSRRCRR
mmetsp:Transcript_27709/g.81016  ORF Transcript_27709/g.81016 Transcript_27709/m.81016 type:complete len:215 (-) Transcript_27709:712-1356(-)